MTSDGFIKVFKENTHELLFSGRKHRLPVTAMGFITDVNGDAQYVLSGSADYTYDINYCKKSMLCKLFHHFFIIFNSNNNGTSLVNNINYGVYMDCQFNDLNN